MPTSPTTRLRSLILRVWWTSIPHCSSLPRAGAVLSADAHRTGSTRTALQIFSSLALGQPVNCSKCTPGNPGGVGQLGTFTPIWGWIPNTPDSGVTGGTGPAPTQILAYWGIVGTAPDPFEDGSAFCALFCGVDGNQVFNKLYPLHPTTSSVSAVTPTASTQPSFGEVASWCQIGTFLSGGGSAWGTPANPSPTYVNIYDQYGRGTSVPLDPVSGNQGGAAAGGAAIIGAWGSCINGAP
jgi:hypothetical protein